MTNWTDDEMADPVASIQLRELIERARANGVRIWCCAAGADDQGRLRGEAGVFLDDGVRYVSLPPDQTAAEALSTLQVCLRRLARFEHEFWQVDAEEPATAYVGLYDTGEAPMEHHPDIVQMMGVGSLR